MFFIPLSPRSSFITVLIHLAFQVGRTVRRTYTLRFFSIAVLESPDLESYHNLGFLVNLHDRPNYKKKTEVDRMMDIGTYISRCVPNWSQKWKIFISPYKFSCWNYFLISKIISTAGFIRGNEFFSFLAPVGDTSAIWCTNIHHPIDLRFFLIVRSIM